MATETFTLDWDNSSSAPSALADWDGKTIGDRWDDEMKTLLEWVETDVFHTSNIDLGDDLALNQKERKAEIKISHDVNGAGNTTTGGATVIDDVYVNGDGHVTNINTENRSLDDWNSADSDVDFGGYDITGVSKIDGDDGNHRIRFDRSGSWVEITDQSNNRQKLVTEDVYVDEESEWVSDWISGHGAGGTGDKSTGGATVIDDIYVDGSGHVTNMNTENRSVSDWGSADSDINMANNDINSVGNLNVDSFTSNRGSSPMQFQQNATFMGNQAIERLEKLGFEPVNADNISTNEGDIIYHDGSGDKGKGLYIDTG